VGFLAGARIGEPENGAAREVITAKREVELSHAPTRERAEEPPANAPEMWPRRCEADRALDAAFVRSESIRKVEARVLRINCVGDEANRPHGLAGCDVGPGQCPAGALVR
jgi:hypothetical protein